MSIGGLAKTVADSAYAYRFINLIQKDFTDWDAFKLGVIDKSGQVIKRPKTDEEKSAYTPFHAAIRALKRKLAIIPGAQTWVGISSAISAVGSRVGLSESEIEIVMENIKPLYEDMVAGDAGYNAKNIAAGTTSGDVVNAGPETLKAKVKKKKLKDFL